MLEVDATEMKMKLIGKVSLFDALIVFPLHFKAPVYIFTSINPINEIRLPYEIDKEMNIYVTLFIVRNFLWIIRPRICRKFFCFESKKNYIQFLKNTNGDP